MSKKTAPPPAPPIPPNHGLPEGITIEQVRASGLTALQIATFRRTVLKNPYQRHNPISPKRNQKQIDFLMLDHVHEVLYGGSAGSGKSDALLMAALQYVEVPGYAAIIFRKTYADLALPGALMDRSQELLSGCGAGWNPQEKKWTFPSGATLSFGYLDTESDRYRYQSSEFQYIAFDELTQFKERDYIYLFTRLRKPADSLLPLRMRAGTNPGGTGHAWVKRRFNIGLPDKLPTDRAFVPALLTDNPYLDQVGYERSLSKLDSQTYKQMRHGDWSDFAGKYFKPSDWPRYQDAGDAYRVQFGTQTHHYRKAELTILIALDWAQRGKKDSDYTAFVVVGMTPDGRMLILDCFNEQLRYEDNAPALAEMCRKWRPAEMPRQYALQMAQSRRTASAGSGVVTASAVEVDSGGELSFKGLGRDDSPILRFSGFHQLGEGDRDLIVASEDDMLSHAMLTECRRYRDIPAIKVLAIRQKGARSNAKIIRAQAAIIRSQNGLFYLPDPPYPWCAVMDDQLSSWTGEDGETDDICDCVGEIGRLADEYNPEEDAENDDSGEILPVGGYAGAGGW